MPVATTSAVIATAAAAQANAAANHAHQERCIAEMAAYNPKTASVNQMQSYAGCVNFVYPNAQSNTVMKGFVGALLLAILIGAVVGALRDPYDRGFAAFGGACLGGAIVLGSFLVIIAVAFIFS